MSDEWMDDYAKWQKWSYEQQYGRGSWDKDQGVAESNDSTPVGFAAYDSGLKRFWDEEKAVGIIEKDGKYTGIACLVAKEVVEKESFVRRFR